MSERLQYDWHAAEDLMREADDLLHQALPKLHAAEALYRMDQDRSRSSVVKADELRKVYDSLVVSRTNLFDIERAR